MRETLSAINPRSNELLRAAVFAGFFCIFTNGTSIAEVSNLAAEEETIPTWSEFSGDFNPNWAGETMRLNWSRGGGGGIYISNPQIPPWEYVPPKPTELLSSSRSVSSQSWAYVSAGGKSASAYSGNDYDSNSSTSDSGSWQSILARYAQVIDLDDYVLGRAISLASIDSDVSDSNYTLTSRIQTEGIIDPIVSSDSYLDSVADAEFAASYQVNRNSQFVLSGSFAGSAGLTALFTITDQTSGEVFYEQSLSRFETDTGIRRFSLRGEVTPGVYDFNLVTSSRNEMTPHQIIEQGQIGELSLDFDWIPWGDGAGDFDDNGVVESRDLILWQEAFGLQDDGDLDLDGDIDKDDYKVWCFSSDAKDVNGDGIDADDFSAWLTTERPVDADGDRDSDGKDFLIWQRTYASSAGSADPADFNRDGAVDGDDVQEWGDAYSNGPGGDADGDGDTDGRDFLIWQRSYTASTFTAENLTSVPEPLSFMLLLIGVLYPVCFLRSPEVTRL